MQHIKILIVDDEEKMRRVIKIYLEKEGFIVDEACDGKEALEKFDMTQFSLVLLDIMMPEIDGWSVCRKIRNESSVPIIMLTARGEEYDKLFGFELGVDDYITKPFSPKEMVARIKAVLKRSNANNKLDTDIIIIGALKFKTKSMQVFLEDTEMTLTPKEFDLLSFFSRNPEIVYSREQLLNQVWGYDFIGDLRTVDTHVKQLREKLGKYKSYIQTVWGTGYKFKVGEYNEKSFK
ncbi:response regulator transcription factor [Paramaledivibacter caminithermalis]|uniref:Stage 0 sporulation protein A homolog n=1 Tax=Paramaledivibacter caminithermalis (strain DSM 15212 / CIP 107654 / DViRD3) TaxID=1121301 RepID=A0A1M6MSB9_PARC5|nr:response regulator transcription factor [Paramaledivibacter caminithermalis]SHJ86302.1 two-component system, OmpR family, response regulator ResD [Paramaledivibacter caminithermalis DSM 15212]